MPKRLPAIDDETLRREAGSLADDVLLIPRQVALLTGLSVGMLEERMRTRPPKPPHPEPREKPRDAIWYSLGEIRRFRAARAEQAEVNAVLARQALPRFADWLARGASASDPLPFALVGPHRRPVDVWATIRGEVPIGRRDTIRWLTLGEYVEIAQRAARAEAAAQAEPIEGHG